MRGLKLAMAALAVVVGLVGAGVATAEGPNAIIASAGCQATPLAANDDGSSLQVTLPFAIDFFGDTYNNLWVNNNGNVTFTGPLSTYTPFGLAGARTPIVAPFFADVDTRGTGSGLVHYGAISAGATEVNGHAAFCVNWVNVGYYGANTDKLNSFQLVLIDRSDTGNPGDFDIEFNYDKVQWETGDASGGSGGIGGSPARIGYSNGTTSSFELPGSGISQAFLDTNATTGLIYNNVNSPFQAGRYVFPVRNGAAIGHSLSGHVWQNAAPAAVGGAFVQACPTPVDTPCHNATTNAAGFYTFNNLPDHTSGGGTLDHDWNLVVYPPSGSGLGTGTLGPVTIAGSDALDQDVILHGPLPLPANASISTPSRGTATSGVPTVYWGDPLTVAFTGCAGGTGSATLAVQDGFTQTVPAVESPPGTYTATFTPPYPHHGDASISFTVSCGTSGTFSIYIDPSGVVVDQHGHPVAGATVTLLRSDDPAGPFLAVPNGSAIMSPANRTNPDTTDATGHFGWDVLAGYYKVTASKDGCSSAESAVLPIPPPVTDLQLVLECAGDSVPPTIASHADVTAEAASAAGAVVTYTSPSATDDVDGPVAVTCAPASGSPFPLGDTTVGCSASDAAGNPATSSFVVHVVDTTAPVIAAHANVTADASSAAGASVTYTAPAATDAVDGPVAVTCSPPSGGGFPLGDTTVDCTATDAHGNPADSSFTVHVSGAGEQLGALLAWVVAQGAGPGTSVPDKLRTAIADLSTGGTCSDLAALDHEAKAQTGKKLTAAQAARIRGDVARIRLVLGC